MGKYNGMVYVYDEEESLAHFGILGQKWGIRRYQNEDRTLTPEGKERYYGKSDSKQKKKNYERLVQINKKQKMRLITPIHLDVKLEKYLPMIK